jgi:hypothetical protein
MPGQPDQIIYMQDGWICSLLNEHKLLKWKSFTDENSVISRYFLVQLGNKHFLLIFKVGVLSTILVLESFMTVIPVFHLQWITIKWLFTMFVVNSHKHQLKFNQIMGFFHYCYTNEKKNVWVVSQDFNFHSNILFKGVIYKKMYL